VSKRHHANRRKSYGRRQHELHERRHREPAPSWDEAAPDAFDAPGALDRMAFLDPRTPRLHYALGD
jgi:hypothetical protein